MQKVLLTGAHGFLAKHLLDELSSTKCSVIALLHSAEKIPERSFSSTYVSIQELIKDEPYFDTIFHLAAYIPEDSTKPDKRLITNNIQLTIQLANAYPSARFVFSSSVAVYGSPVKLPIHLNTPFNKPDYYGLSKLAAEAVIQNLDKYAIIRFSSILGPSLRAKTFVPKIIELAKKTRTITLLGSGSRLQDYIDVRDAARLCIRCAHLIPNISILGVSGNAISNLQVAEKIQHHIPCNIIMEGHDRSDSFQYEINDSYKQIDFELRYSIDNTIKDMTS